MKLLKYFAILFVTSNQIVAQYTEPEVRALIADADEQQLVVESSRMLQENYYYFSELIVDKLLEMKPNSPNYHYRKGFIMLDSRWEFAEALKHFEIAATDIDKNFDMYSAKETSCPQDVYYHMARCYHLDEQLDKAIEHYNKFILASNPKSEKIPQAKLRILQCNEAKTIIPNPTDALVKNLGTKINAGTPEYAPVISWDGTALFYTSRRQWKDNSSDPFKDPMYNHWPEDIYVSYTKDQKKWSEPEKLEFCTAKINEATVYVSNDEKKIYTYKDTEGSGDIYLSEMENHHYMELKPLDHKGINTPFWETHCAVSSDGNTIFFTSNRKGGLGGRDIYYIKKDQAGKWSEPINMGPNVNTEWDEESPFISVDNKTLYFSSNGPKSIGEFDIFSIALENLIATGTPKNMGYPINSTGDDVFYTTTANGETAYLSSFRKNGLGEKDIYQIHFKQPSNVIYLSGVIRFKNEDQKVPENLKLVLTCEDCIPNKVTMSYRDRDAAFMNPLEDCQTYRLDLLDSLDATKVLYTSTFKTNCDQKAENVYKEIILNQENENIVANEVKPEPVYENPYLKHMYGYNKHKLTTQSGELKGFVSKIDEQLAAGRKDITIEINSSASNVPTKTFKTNDILAQTRADKIKEELEKHFKNKDVKVVINSVKVDGPEYNKDFLNAEKYNPFQFIELKVK